MMNDVVKSWFKKNYYFKIYPSLIHDLRQYGLTHADIQVFTLLLHKHNIETELWYYGPTEQVMSEYLSYSLRTIYRAITRLCEQQWMEVIAQLHCSDLQKINIYGNFRLPAKTKKKIKKFYKKATDRQYDMKELICYLRKKRVDVDYIVPF